MKLAILMSTYNGEQYLEEQIKSILDQKLDIPFDLIVRDDGSSDGTLQILNCYAEAGKLQYYSGANVGAARGFMYLLKENPGYDYYAFADQDDIWDEDKVQKGLNAVKDHFGLVLYCSNAALIHSNMDPIGRNVHRERPTYNLVSSLCLASSAQGCTSVFNRKLAELIQNRPLPEIFIMHDSLLTCLCVLAGGEIIYDHCPTMKYRMHGSNVFGMVTARQGLMRVIKNRFAEIAQKKEISMYDQAKGLLAVYGDLICEENRKLCRIVIGAEHSWIDRMKLVLNGSLQHDTLNMTITKKLQILLGNG